MRSEEVAIGDCIGLPNFPYNLCDVVDIRKDVFIVEFRGKIDKEGNKPLGIITKKQFDSQGFDIMHIEDASVVQR